jgi:hypothetical protein
VFPGAAIVKPYDLAAIVDPEGLGRDGAGDIDCGEAAARIHEEATAPAAAPHDVAAVVDPEGDGGESSGDIDGSKATAAIEEAMAVGRTGEIPYDLATRL